MVPPFTYTLDDREAPALYKELRQNLLSGWPLNLGELHDLLKLLNRLEEFHTIPGKARNLVALGVEFDFGSAKQLLGVIGEEAEVPHGWTRRTWPLRKLSKALQKYMEENMKEHIRDTFPDLPGV